MSEPATADQTMQLDPEPVGGWEAHEAARQREEDLTNAYEIDDYETGERLSLMYSATSRHRVDHNRELFDPPLKIEWSVVDEESSGDDLSAFMMTVPMPRLLRVRIFDGETSRTRYLSDGLASALVLAFREHAPREYVHTETNLKHRIFFAMQQLQTETDFKPHNLRDYVSAKGGSKFDSGGSWLIKVGPDGGGDISQTIRFQLEKPPGWHPAMYDDDILLSDLSRNLATNPAGASMGSSDNPSS
ncbi:hypothetical protein EHS25_001306 [Saitozyma podzolica]|uniref:Uncharacterized protein n=1 Tax=Saitozyma podzolica TaxID=1890683 RepID=A0A427YHZ7_9TREE|nr:hypothetical protein EHS25_001306 [Saitozyma podzolica]